jgi:hypothetical protein
MRCEGCGTGCILQALCRPAAHLDDVPSDLPLPDSAERSRTRACYERLHKIGRPVPAQRELHLSRLAGLDIKRDSLEKAALLTKPAPSLAESVSQDDDDLHGYKSSACRWEKLKVELWQGSLDVHNDALDDYECFIASEVVEHLHPGTLSEFGPAVLGTYRPRLVIVTTPNCTSHCSEGVASSSLRQTISPPSSPGNRIVNCTASFPRSFGLTSGSPDPTGRTDRIFVR